MAVVYWIHLEEHTDIFTQGYVGVSITDAKTRFKVHKHDAKRMSSHTVHKAIRKYGTDIIVSTVVEGYIEYCYVVENKLRPNVSIGWNIAIGGSPATMLGRKHSEATKIKMSVTRTGRKPSEEALENIRAASKLRIHVTKSAWLNPKANINMWKSAKELYELFIKFDSCGQRRLAKASGKFSSDNLETITKMFNSGWIPANDGIYLEWLNDCEVING